jgi:glycosyltransferase involved in cell wall biosynthesis
LSAPAETKETLPVTAHDTDWPRISVVTPSYNQGCFLEQCIRSVLDQGYPNLEYIILDGGSTDDSLSIISKHAPQLTWWVSEPDGGQSAAINRGFRRASGVLVAWLNSDDFYLPGALKAVAAAYRQNPRASFYLGNGQRVDKAGNPLSSFFPNDIVRFHRPALVHGLNYILQPATFISRKHLTKAGYLDEQLKFGMDSDLWLRLSALAEPESVQALLAASREYDDTKTATGAFQRVEELRRVAEKYSGLPITPGALCYLLDTIQTVARTNPEVFNGSFLTDLSIFWKGVHRTFSAMQARADGFPLVPGVDPDPSAESDAQTTAGLQQHAEAPPNDTQSDIAGSSNGNAAVSQAAAQSEPSRSAAARLLRLPRWLLRHLRRRIGPRQEVSAS